MNESENLWNVDSLLKLSEDLQAENEQYRLLLTQKENQQIQKENEKAQKLFEEAGKKEENANDTLEKAKVLEVDFKKHLSDEAKYIRKQEKADMQKQLQKKLRIQTATLGIWTWIIAFISIIQTGYILYVNQDIVATIPDWFLNRGRNVMNVANLFCRVYQRCYEYLAKYVHSYVAVGLIALVSVGILAGVFVLVRIAFDRITEKWDDRW